MGKLVRKESKGLVRAAHLLSVTLLPSLRLLLTRKQDGDHQEEDGRPQGQAGDG